MEDKELIQRILGGNKEAFLLLIDRHKWLVFHMVSRVVNDPLDIEELCQDVFVKVYETLESFKGNSKLSTWIATISYRMALNHIKKKNWSENTEDLDGVDYKIGFTDQTYESKDFSGFVHSLVDQMPQPYRTILTMFHLEGFSYPEIVEITGMPEGTVKNYLFRARNKLKTLMEPYFGSDLETYKESRYGS